jgi:predicted nucleotidyltransferase
MVDFFKLRDRDAVLSKEGLIFRVYGYFHPPDAYVCDVEYAPDSIYKSIDPRALRVKRKREFYKFYTDEGLRFVREKYPQYTIFYAPLKEFLVGVKQEDIWKVRRPDEKLRQLLEKKPGDDLLEKLQQVLGLIASKSGVRRKDFGVFGSFLHGFYHPDYSDIDFIIYGRENLKKLRETLCNMYSEGKSPLLNEFQSEKAIEGKNWRFVNYTPKEYLWHQKRKMIYGLIEKAKSGRSVKVEFEPVKDWAEIHNEYSLDMKIKRKGWVGITASVTDDRDAPYIPSIYQIEPSKILKGPKVDNLQRIISYVEEFRMQAENGEEVHAEGNLEEVITSSGSFHQITLTYGPRYYEQSLKTIQPHVQH